MDYEFLEHAADAKFRAYGKTLEEKFTNAALAMTSIITENVKAKIRNDFKIEGTDQENLLYNFLEELLFLFDSESFILSKVDKINITGNTLSCEVLGDAADKYETHSDVKAVTYNEMEITDEYVQVVVDL